MIRTVMRTSNVAEEAALAAMFEARKAVFVDLLKWDLPVLGGRFEIDQFDDEQARYLIVEDRAGGHLGSARLLPTDRPHILGDLFPNLCSGPVPTGPTVREITRFCLDRRQSAASRRIVRNRLVTGLVADALEQGTTQFTGVAELSWLQQILAFGWRCRPLGVPVRTACGTLGALAIQIDESTPQRLAANGIWTGDWPSGQLEREAA